ncbi:MAG: glutathione S-transferase N-terminal domain-containing protein [Hyphomicrobiales bacterium]
MILRSSPTSPFGRKIKIALDVLGLADTVSVVSTDTLDPEDTIRQQNPLGKIPALLLDDGTVLYDSRVIVEYLDQLAGGGRILPGGSERFRILTLQALADGIMDAAILQIYEIRFRAEDRREPKWIEHQAAKVERGLFSLNASQLPEIRTTPDIGSIALACALGYLDFRFEGKWRSGHENLIRWLASFSNAVPAFVATMPR